MTGPVVVLDLAAGQARVGGTVVAVSAEPGGGLRYGETSLRALGFGERWRLVAEQARELGRAVLASAAVLPPPGDDQIAQVLALHLAGARTERRAPAFTAQLAALVATGWAPGEILAAPADLVDLITGTPNAEPRDGSESPEEQGWTRIVLGAVEAAPSPVVPDVAEVLRALEADLRDRGAPPAAPGPAPVLPDQSASWETRPVAWRGRDGSDEGARATQRPTPGDAPTPGRAAPAAPAQHTGQTTPELSPAPNDPAATPRPSPRDLTATPPARRVAMPLNGDPESGARSYLPARPAATEVPARAWAPRPAAPAVRPGRGAGSPPVPIRDSWLADPHAPAGSAGTLIPSWTAGQLAPPSHNALRTPEAAARTPQAAARTPQAADRIPAARVAAVADLVAALLDEESDLRGLLP